MGPFGVELPESFGASESAAGGDVSPGGTEIHTNSEAKEPESKPTDSIASNASASRSRDSSAYEGIESRQDGRGQRTREEYDSNYAADLAAVRMDSRRLGEFAAIYPREYVVRAIHELNSERPAQSSQPQRSQQTDPYADKFEKYDRMFASFESAAKEHRVNVQLNNINGWHASLEKKYPDADPRVVDAMAIAADEKGIKITQSVFEKLYKQDHEQREKYYAQKYRSKAETQLTANKKARDIPPGGQPMGNGARPVKTIKEATAQALAALSNK